MEKDFSLEDVVKFANDIVIVTEAEPLDNPGPKIVYVNKAFTDLTGYAPEEVIGKTPRILQGPDSHSETRAHIRAALEKKEPIRTAIVNYSKSGRKYWLDINIIPLKDGSGKVTHFAAIERDLTDIKEAEAVIKKKNTELAELNETKNKFLGIASHDLRNPLFTIRSFSELLEDGTVGEVNVKQKEMLGKIFHASTFMKALLENLLDISKIESGKIDIKKQTQDLNQTVRQQVEFNQLLAQKKNITLHMNLSNIPPLSFDQSAIIQVMGNFIGNAIKFSPPDTAIVVATDKVEDGVRFSVRDEGPGLSKEDQELLFKEFQTLTAKPTAGEKSTGLGLAIVKKLIHLHNGEVGVESTLGMGSTFYFTLPIE
ncbi:MAG: PAS domain-containing protein [Nitrospirota bacterium]|nr:MAG: PAS domain-containing protein [Nitrospirota bacterium]